MIANKKTLKIYLCGSNWSYAFLVRGFGCALFDFKGGKKMEKEIYSDPELDLIEFLAVDVILTSANDDKDQGEWDEV